MESGINIHDENVLFCYSINFQFVVFFEFEFNHIQMEILNKTKNSKVDSSWINKIVVMFWC